jgi:hypothetical protein
MLRIAPQKFRCRERHETLFVSTRIVFPAEGDTLSIEGDQAVIADRHAMRVPA